MNAGVSHVRPLKDQNEYLDNAGNGDEVELQPQEELSEEQPRGVAMRRKRRKR